MAFSLDNQGDPRGPLTRTVNARRREILDEQTAQINQDKGLVEIRAGLEDIKARQRANKLGAKYDEPIIQGKLEAGKENIAGAKARREQTERKTELSNLNEATNYTELLNSEEGLQQFRSTFPDLATNWGLNADNPKLLSNVENAKKGLTSSRQLREKMAILGKAQEYKTEDRSIQFGREKELLKLRTDSRMEELKARNAAAFDRQKASRKYKSQWASLTNAPPLIKAFMLAYGTGPLEENSTPGEREAAREGLERMLAVATMKSAKRDKPPTVAQKNANVKAASTSVIDSLSVLYNVNNPVELFENGTLTTKFEGFDALYTRTRQIAETGILSASESVAQAYQTSFFVPRVIGDKSEGGKFYMLAPGYTNEMFEEFLEQIAKNPEIRDRRSAYNFLLERSQDKFINPDPE